MPSWAGVAHRVGPPARTAALSSRSQADHRDGQRPARRRCGIALEDLDAQVVAVRVRDRRRCANARTGTASCSTPAPINPKQLDELQHELETLERRQSSLEDSLLEVMERREQLAGEQAARARRKSMRCRRSGRRRSRRATTADRRDRPGSRGQRGARRDELVAGLDPDLVQLYERQRAAAGAGAARLQGRRCGACRIEIDRGELARISAARRRRGAALPGVRRDPVAGQRRLTSEGARRGRRRVAR